MGIIIIGIGLILMIDGIASILYFRENATRFEQSVRILRTGIGFYLLYSGLTI